MQGTYGKNAYMKNQVMTAPQSKLIVMLYDGAIKNLKLSERAIEKQDRADLNKYIIKAQDIIMELMTTLNMDVGGEVAQGLHDLYDFMYVNLVNANINQDVEKIILVREYLEELREVWNQI